MNDGIGAVDQPVVVVFRQTKLRTRQISAENTDARLEVFVKAREIHVQLKSAPQARRCLLRITRPYQQVQRGIMILQEIGGYMRADVSGRTGQEYRHVAPLVPVLTVSPWGGV